MHIAAMEVKAIPTKNKLNINPILEVSYWKSSFNLTARVDSRERIRKSPIIGFSILKVTLLILRS